MRRYDELFDVLNDFSFNWSFVLKARIRRLNQNRELILKLFYAHTFQT